MVSFESYLSILGKRIGKESKFLERKLKSFLKNEETREEVQLIVEITLPHEEGDEDITRHQEVIFLDFILGARCFTSCTLLALTKDHFEEKIVEKGSHKEKTLSYEACMIEFQNDFIDIHTTTIDNIEHEEKNKIMALIEKSNEIYIGFTNGINVSNDMIKIINTPLKEEYD